MLARIFTDIFIFFAAILIPGWTFFVLGAIGAYFFYNFYEFIIISLIVDAVYGFPIPGWYGFRFVFTTLAICVFVIIKIFKVRVRAF